MRNERSRDRHVDVLELLYNEGSPAGEQRAFLATFLDRQILREDRFGRERDFLAHGRRSE